jgi:RNA polymerase sigma-70 factor (ECF subfamily)
MSESLDARFTRLFAEHGPVLARLAAAYERDPRDREDLMQDIAFAIWRALPSYRGESSERTFICRIGHNRAITHRSRAHARQQRLDSADLIDTIPDPKADPSATLIAAEGHAGLLDAVRRLTPVLKETIILSLEGLSHQEIADVLGATPQTVAVRLTRARTALAKLLSGSEARRNTEPRPTR